MLSGRDIRRLMGAGARDALEEAAEQVRAAAARDIPKGDPAADPDPAFALREHGRVEMSPDGLYVTVRFDGPYAAWQHENQHAEHPRGGKAKFLEDNLKELLPRLQNIVAGEVRARTAGDGARGRR